MDYDKLIEQLNAWNEQHLSVVCGSKHFACDYLCENEDCIVVRAATALSTLQAENAQLRESRDHWKRLAHELSEGVNGKDAEHERLQAENEKLRAELENYRKGHCSEGGCAAEKDRDTVMAELEQVKAERDAAVESIPHECKTCVYHTVFFNGCTLDHDCTNPDGGCSNNYDRWRWRGMAKED